MTNITIEKMKTTDIKDVMEIEKASFATTWSKDIFIQEVSMNQFAHYFTAKLNEEIIGYAGIWIVKDDAQVTNIAILREYRGRKYGEQLFYYLMQTAIQMGVSQLSLEVRASNIVAQKMYRKFGLVPGGIRKRYYTDNQEDAIVMWVKF